MHTPTLLRLLLASLLGSTGLAAAQLTFDGTPTLGSPGAQNGSGAWDLTTSNWWDGSRNVTWNNDGATTAVFGNNSTNTGGTITVSGTVKVGGLKFSSLSALPASIAHTLNGGTIAFADNAIIEAGDNTSSGSTTGLFLNLNSTLTGNNLTFQRDPTVATQTFQYARLTSANPGLTGTLTLKATGTGRGIFLLTSTAATVAGISDVVVESGSVFAAGGTNNTYANNFSIAGIGNASGAIRVDGTNAQFTGQITLAADAAIHTNTSITGGNFSGSIVESGGSFGLQRTTATLNSTLTLSGASTYTGATTLGRSGSVSGGTTILDFSAATAPASNILYHDVAAGPLSLWGGSAGITQLTVKGSLSGSHLQQFGDVTANTTRSNIVLAPGTDGGSLTLALGGISRTTSASLGFIAPAGATITTSLPDGFIGPWATFSDGAGVGAWAGVSGGVLTTFTGDLEYQTGMAISDLPSYTTESNLSITNTSSGAVQAGAAVALGSVTMSDDLNSRTLDIGDGNTLTMGATAGIQIVSGGKDLAIGVAGNAGALKAATSASQLWLTNMSLDSTLTINSVLSNNGAGVLSVFVNGVGNTILAGENLFTGAVQVNSGSLEVSSSSGLGTSAGGVSILYGAALRLAGDIALADAMTISGLGINNDGVIRNVSGDNHSPAFSLKRHQRASCPMPAPSA